MIKSLYCDCFRATLHVFYIELYCNDTHDNINQVSMIELEKHQKVKSCEKQILLRRIY